MNLVFFFVCLFSIFSCASVAKEKRLYTYIADKSRFFLLQPEGIGQTMDMAQYISAEFRGQKYFFVSWVKADKNAIEIILFNELGAGIGELSYRDGTVNFSSTVFPKSAMRFIKPEYIIADFQLCFYDSVLLGKALEGSDLVLEINKGNRRIIKENEAIIEIIKTKNMVRFTNNLRKYAFTLEGDFYGIQ